MSHYEVLGVAPTSDDAALRRAYVALARRHHPDVAGGDAARMRAINDAWATLGDPVRRATYDSARMSGWVHRTHAAPPADPDDVADSDTAGADLDDDRAVRVTVRLPGWVSLVPVALFAMAVAAFGVGVVMVSPPLLALALMFLLLSIVFFLAAPFIALFAARAGGRQRESAQ